MIQPSIERTATAPADVSASVVAAAVAAGGASRSMAVSAMATGVAAGGREMGRVEMRVWGSGVGVREAEVGVGRFCLMAVEFRGGRNRFGTSELSPPGKWDLGI
jgi:hypothetical protein